MQRVSRRPDQAERIRPESGCGVGMIGGRGSMPAVGKSRLGVVHYDTLEDWLEIPFDVVLS